MAAACMKEIIGTRETSLQLPVVVVVVSRTQEKLCILALKIIYF